MNDDRDLLGNVSTALRSVINPRTGRDLISSGLVRGMKLDSGRVQFILLGEAGEGQRLAEEARSAAEAVEGIESAQVELRPAHAGPAQGGRKLPVIGQGGPDVGESAAPEPPTPRPVTPVPPQPESIPGIRNVVAVSSGKGGVGKSTVATNLAVALAATGRRVGLLDADVYGPDIPIMFGIQGRPRVTGEQRVVPLEAHGVKLMSVGFLIGDDTPAIWRGPIVMGIIRQFLQQVDWGELDFLIVDMPPGTGDAQLSLVQLVHVDGAVMVTTPQGVATADVLKSIKMFEHVDVPVLGLIENMSGFACPHCGQSTDLFGRGGGRKLAATAGVPFLGEVPLGASVVSAGDAGRPSVTSSPESPESTAFVELARRIAEAVETAGEHAEASHS